MRIKAALAAALAAAAISLTGCAPDYANAKPVVPGGDPRRGAAAVSRYGCGSCHTIAGITGANGLVGPPLTGLRNRMYVAGMLENEPANLVRWIRDPKAINPKTAMPKLGVTEQDASDIAAYIYSIR